MSVTTEKSSVRINGALVSITGTSGAMSPTWTVEVDGVEVAREKVGDDRVIPVPLPDGTRAEVAIHQAAFGPTEVEVRHDGEVVATSSGFLL